MEKQDLLDTWHRRVLLVEAYCKKNDEEHEEEENHEEGKEEVAGSEAIKEVSFDEMIFECQDEFHGHKFFMKLPLCTENIECFYGIIIMNSMTLFAMSKFKIGSRVFTYLFASVAADGNKAIIRLVFEMDVSNSNTFCDKAQRNCSFCWGRQSTAYR